MNRRKFGLMASSGAIALGAAAGFPKAARAGVTADQAAQLKTTLTPLGGERAGNADGSIPAWTGGLTTPPAGWTASQAMPDMFASDPLVLKIDQSNVAQYGSMLPDGLVAMINKYPSFNIQVYPTHRTASAPQWVYDNTYQNALNSSLDPAGGRFGFNGAYGGYAFPVLDSDPAVAGSQVIWNHLTRWEGCGPYGSVTVGAYNISSGSITLGGTYILKYFYPYYEPSGSVATFSGWYEKIHLDYLAPPVLVGQQLCEWSPTNALKQPTQAWELLNGQGRVRKAPELTYDTPTATQAGLANYDESYGFYGSPDKYNWTYVGKKEIYVPYNNNKLLNSDPYKVIGKNFIDPDAVRYEKHRVHVIDALLAPGERHQYPHRRLYVDEDCWHVVHADYYDASGALVKANPSYLAVMPQAPGVVCLNTVSYWLQTGSYTVGTGSWATANDPGYNFVTPISEGLFNPQSMSAQGQY